MCSKKLLAVALWIVLAAVSLADGAAKYVILFIGDGMGPEHVKAAGMYANGQDGTLSFESWPVRTTVSTDNAEGNVTDSAAAGTAIATGRKVKNGVISRAIPGDESDLETILEYLQKQGKSAGLVTTSYLLDATPSAFAAHSDGRGDFSDIEKCLLGATRPEVLMGGAKHLKAEDVREAGYVVAENRDEFVKLDTKAVRIAGLFGGNSTMPYVTDSDSRKYPSLSEMTTTALAALERDPDGFFLMVEGGRIDHAGHANKLAEDVTETAAFSEAVAVGVAWAKNKDALLMVTADHETGGLSVEKNNGKGELPDAKYQSKKHTAARVGLYAMGSGAERLAAATDNTQIRAAILGEPLPAAPEKAGGVSKPAEELEPAGAYKD